MAKINVTQQMINEYRKLTGNYVLSDFAISEKIEQDIRSGKLPKEFAGLATDAQNVGRKAASSNLFGYGFNTDIDDPFSIEKTPVYPEIQPTESQSEAIGFLKDLTNEAETTFKNREDEAGALSATINAGHEVINWWRKNFENRQNDFAKSTVKKELKDLKDDLQLLEQASKGQVGYTDFLGNTRIKSFEEVFKQRRGVKFDKKAVADCTKKAEQFAAIKTSVEMINNTKETLGYTTKGDVHSQMYPQEASSAIIKAFQLSGISSLEEMNKIFWNN